MVETRGSKRKAPDADLDDEASRYTGNSVLLWDLQLHTTDTDVVESFQRTFPHFGLPSRICFLNRQFKSTKFTYCCVVSLQSVDEARQALRTKSIKIDDIFVKVGPYEDGFVVTKGKYWLKLFNLEFRSGPKAFRSLRTCFNLCACSDIQIIRQLKKCHLLEGCAKLRFRTIEDARAAKEALKDLNKEKKDEGIIEWEAEWNIEWNDER